MSQSGRRLKFVFVTGGVVSSIGKGLAAASIGALLETRGLKVAMTKMDPYINVDPGTMSPFQHGEVFVTDDGAETDLDLGHYQRFTKARLEKKNSFTTGQVYDAVISRERRGDYLGGTVQVIPHITDQIKQNILNASHDVDVSIVEVGGTVGDIESLPFLEAIRQFRNELGKGNSLLVHLTLVPFIRAAGELKTKPTQHSVRELRNIGLHPDVLICRADQPMPVDVRKKISLFCNVESESVFESLDVDNIYRIPKIFHEQGMDERITQLLGIWTARPNLDEWNQIIERIEHPKHKVQIAIVGKYLSIRDSYKSLFEALIHAGLANEALIEVVGIDAEQLTAANVNEMLKGYKAIVVPGGFGDRGIAGKLLAIQYAREKRVPFLGICLGMQLACVEFARHVLRLSDAHSEEFQSETKDPVIHLMQSQAQVQRKGGSMRLGAYECRLVEGTRTHKAYGTSVISERHRHRYEFNSSYAEKFQKAGLVIAGRNGDGTLVEVVEALEHPWFVACQFHPELKSRPMEAHPLFVDLIAAALKGNESAK